MMSHNGSKIFFLLLLVILTLAVVGLILYKQLPATNLSVRSQSLPNSSEPQALATAVVTPEQLVANYEQQAKSLLKVYLEKNQAEPLREDLPADKKNNWQKLADDLQNKFLNLKVPAVYKDLHLQLVLDFNSLSQGLDGDYKLASTAQNKIDELVGQYSWLK